MKPSRVKICLQYTLDNEQNIYILLLLNAFRTLKSEVSSVIVIPRKYRQLNLIDGTYKEGGCESQKLFGFQQP